MPLIPASHPAACAPEYTVSQSGDYALTDMVPCDRGEQLAVAAFPAWMALGLDAPDAPAPTGVTVSKLAFRRLFTDEERVAVDAFNAGYESSPTLDAATKARVRTGLKDFEVATEIALSDPGVAAMLSLYEALGLIAPGRAAEIGATA